MLARSSAGWHETMQGWRGQRMLARSSAGRCGARAARAGQHGPISWAIARGVSPAPPRHGLPDVSAETRRRPSTRSGTFPRKRGTRPSTRSGTFPRKRGNPSGWPGACPPERRDPPRRGLPDVSAETRVRACPCQRQRCLTSAVGYAGEGGRGGDGWPVSPAGPAQPAARSVSRSAVAPSGWPRPTAMPSR
jgi:hypothetical protein